MLSETSTKRIEFLGLPLDTAVSIGDVCDFLRDNNRLRMVTFVNPGAWALARRSPEYLDALHRMNLTLADGEGVAWACRKMTHAPCARISFDMTSLADPFFRTAVEEKTSLMLIGSKPGIDEAMSAKLQTDYPGLNIIGTQHGYGDFASKVEDVMAKAPGTVIVAMGTPRQELFLLALRDAGYSGLAITCGGFFDQHLESDPYYPDWIDRLNLRFAYRLYKEPGRLWRRYLIDYPYFLGQLIKGAMHRNDHAYLSSGVSK